MASKNEKKTSEVKPTVKAQKKVQTTAVVQEQKPSKEIKTEENEKKLKVEKPEMVNIFSTTYGYWRYFVRAIIAEGGISKFRFVKDAESYNGKISVAKEEVDKAKKALAEYQKKSPDIKTMWH